MSVNNRPQPQNQSQSQKDTNTFLIYFSLLPFLYCIYWYNAWSHHYPLGISYWDLGKWFMVASLVYVLTCNGREATRWMVYTGAMTYLGHYIFWYGIPYVCVKLHPFLPYFTSAIQSRNSWWIFVRVLLSLPGGAIAAALMIKLAAYAGGWEGLSFKSENYETIQAREAQMKAAQTAGQRAVSQTTNKPQEPQNFSIPGVDIYINRRPDPRALDKIIGLEKPKEIVMNAMKMILSNDKTYAEYGLTPPGGLLLYGPPGTGKTSFARACAEAFGCAFYVVNASSLTASLVGQSEQAVRSLFAHARAHKPAVIFWDEIDAVGQRRDGMNLNRPSDLVLNVLLAEMDGFNSKGEKGILVIGATNRVDILDPALLRPGRFDYKVEVGLPGLEDRVALLKHFLKNRKHQVTEEELYELATKTEGFSPADILALVDRAAWKAVDEKKPIGIEYLLFSLKESR